MVLNHMRFSPVLLAVLTVSTTLGLSRPAAAQSSERLAAAAPDMTALAAERSSLTPVVPESNPLLPPADSLVLVQRSPFQGAVPPTLNSQASPVAPAVQIPEQTAPAQSQPGTPPAGSPSPEQETPNQIQVTPTPTEPTSPGTAPSLPTFPTPGTTPAPQPQAQPDEPRVLVAEVVVQGATGELETEVYNAVRTEPGRTTTRSQLQEDVNAILATGFFGDARVEARDTALGVQIVFIVEPNPVLQGVRVEGNEVLPQTVVNEIFAPQLGSILNFRRFQEGVEALNKWYRDNGYVLAQVVDAPRVSPDGTATLVVAEGVIEDIQVRFLNRDGEPTDDEGKPITGRTRSFIITREFRSQPGDVFNQQRIQQDLQRAFGLGIFEDLRVSLNPGQDPRKVDVTVNVIERNTGSIAAGGGISSASGLFATVSYQEQNLGGNNQRVAVELQVGQRELLFDASFTDPWIAGDPNRTSYTVNAFSRLSIPLVFEGGPNEVTLPNGDRPRVQRIGGGISFGRPIPPFDPDWRVSAGLQYQRVSIRDRDGDLSPRDQFGNLLSFSNDGQDDLFLAQFAVSRDRRNNPVSPTNGSFLRFSTEQSIPIGSGSIFLNRLRGSYSYYIPVRLLNFSDGPQALAFNVQGGVILGDLPPYEAFSLGGTDSIRGYDAGDVGSGRAFALATVEYRFPIFSIVGGTVFVDVGSDLGTGNDVPGDPAGLRGKPGSGFGYGVGVRVQSPLGAIRIDYAINDQGDSRIHFGIGERF